MILRWFQLTLLLLHYYYYYCYYYLNIDIVDPDALTVTAYDLHQT